jgi:hypothetical protein
MTYFYEDVLFSGVNTRLPTPIHQLWKYQLVKLYSFRFMENSNHNTLVKTTSKQQLSSISPPRRLRDWHTYISTEFTLINLEENNKMRRFSTKWLLPMPSCCRRKWNATSNATRWNEVIFVWKVIYPDKNKQYLITRTAPPFSSCKRRIGSTIPRLEGQFTQCAMQINTNQARLDRLLIVKIWYVVIRWTVWFVLQPQSTVLGTGLIRFILSSTNQQKFKNIEPQQQSSNSFQVSDTWFNEGLSLLAT